MEKYVILQNFATTSDGRPTQINLGKASEEFQKKILEFFRGCEIKDDGNRCFFELFYNSNIALTTELSLCLGPRKQVAVEWEPCAAVNKAKKDEMVIVVNPSPKSSDCVVSHKHDCPLCIAAGQCTSPLIRKYIGQIFFPNKYCKQK